MGHNIQSIFGTAAAHIRDADPAELMAVFNRAEHLIGRVSSAAKDGRKRDQKAATHQYIESNAVRLLALIRGHRGLPQRELAHRMTIAELKAMTHQMEFRRDCGEPVRVKLKEKAAIDLGECGGYTDACAGDSISIGAAGSIGSPITSSPVTAPEVSYRPTCDFGILRRAMQIMVRDVLEATLDDELVDYNRAGFGPRAAIAKVAEILASGEYTHVVVGDIKNCFGSLKHEGVKDSLPLPGSIVEHVVFLPKESPLSIGVLPMGSSIDNVKEKVRKGIPQGSLVSPLIARLLLGPAFRASALGGEVVSFVDDFLVFAHNEGEAAAIQHALACNFNNHPSGSFAFKHIKAQSLSSWFGFLGRRILAVKSDGATQVVIAPSTQSLTTFINELDRRISAGTSSERVSQYILSWGRLWDWSLANEYSRIEFESFVFGTVLSAGSMHMEAAHAATSEVLGCSI